MNSSDLQEKWRTIEPLPREGDYDHIRITAACRAELFLGVSPDGDRCLILMLPTDFELDFHPVEGEQLSLTKLLSPNRNYVVLTLLNSDFHDVFNDLVVSMYNFIWQMEDVAEYSQLFIATFRKWARFFNIDTGDRLQKTTIQGMFGEIVYLRKLLTIGPVSQVNTILESWRGPYDQGHDFVMADKNVEVKTRMQANTGVHIANENQLDMLEGKGLELAVVAVDEVEPGAISLRELAREMVTRIEGLLGDSQIFYTAMLQKNLTPANLGEYDDFLFRPLEMAVYDCLREGFPRIVRSDLSDSLFGIRYGLNTAELDDFLLDSEELQS